MEKELKKRIKKGITEKEAIEIFGRKLVFQGYVKGDFYNSSIFGERGGKLKLL